MKYRMAVKDKDLFRDYIVEERECLHFAVFEEKDKDTILDLLLQQFKKEYPEYSENKGMMQWFYDSAVDEENVVYIIDFCNRSFTEYGVIDPKDFRQAVLNQEADLKKFAEKSAYIKKTYDENTIVKDVALTPGYKKFSFFDAENAIEIPFRLKECKGEDKKPLLIYLHGAGCMGHDNLKQFAEFKSLGIKLKEDCFVVLPQCDTYTGNNLTTINLYTKGIGSLAKKLAESYPIDPERIYVMGISYGGACTWYSLYNNPGFFAAAIPLMGYFLDIDSNTFDAEVFRNEKIWVGHANDDEVVSADCDIKTYRKLKNICEIRFSFYPRDGHKMMKMFYKEADWQEWLFSKRRTKKD